MTTELTAQQTTHQASFVGTQVMDDSTLFRLIRWIERTLHQEEQYTALDAMSRVVENDPSLTDLGWPRVAEIAGVR